ncbi:hypothetical protein [Gemmatimonas sp.]|uniref:hypothetical protein n=1 Tax=Gemmatimonas sp. TaxID=1962908 RepID=UPI003562652D
MDRSFPWATWSLMLAPVTIVLHELGHLLVARAVGFPNPTLHFNSVDPGTAAGLPPAALGLATLAGPLVSAALALGACAWIFWRAASPWATALAVTAASRFVVGVPYTIVNVGAWLIVSQLAPPEFDEYKAGVALAWSGDALLAGTSLIPVVVFWTVNRRLRAGERAAAWSGLLIGTTVGWAIWLLGAGPALLP